MNIIDHFKMRPLFIATTWNREKGHAVNQILKVPIQDLCSVNWRSIYKLNIVKVWFTEKRAISWPPYERSEEKKDSFAPLFTTLL